MTDQKDSTFPIFLRNLTIASLLYPLDRIQSVKQIQSTFVHQKYKLNHNIGSILSLIPALCTHYGILNTFRGFQSYVLRFSSVFFGFNLVNHMNFSDEPLPDEGIKVGIMLLVHIITYPIENIKIRMMTDLYEKRLYQGVADCYSKMKNFQGIRCFYQGFLISFPHLYAQIKLTKFIYEKLTSNQGSSGLNALMYFFPSVLIAEFLLYPFDTIKKVIQINGSMGHEKQYGRIRDVMKLFSLPAFYRGFGFRLGLLGLYSGANFLA